MSSAVETRTSSSPDPWVFYPVVLLVLGFVVFGVVATDTLSTVAADILSWVLSSFGWLFVVTSAGFLILGAYLGFSRYGKLRLGLDSDRPEFRTASWVAMMFSAGMGIGLMFFGVAEPISHLAAPPLGLEEPGTQEAAALSMQYTYFHWALTPWALYGIVGLVIGYVCMRKGRPNLVSAAFYPLLGERVYGPIGKAIDVLAIWATLFGSATSLGFGAAQINSGLNFLWDVKVSEGLQVLVVALLTVLFVLSAITGVAKGVQILSNVNMVLAIALAVFVLFFGPLVFILSTASEAAGNYAYQLIPMSFRTGAFGGGEWLNSWTIFYWAWWISWTPFVGTFLARISRGRTIREYLLGVLLVPSGVSMAWFAIFGGAAIDAQLSGSANLIEAAAVPEVSLFTMLETLPVSSVTSTLVIFLVALFFVSGADAASVVMGTLASRGVLEPKRHVVATFGVLMGASAGVLLLAGGLTALQQLAIISALPFVVIMIGMVVGMMKEMRAERLPIEITQPPPVPAVATQQPNVAGEMPAGS